MAKKRIQLTPDAQSYTDDEIEEKGGESAFPVTFPIRFPKREGEPHRKPFDEETASLLEELRRLEILTGACL